MIKFNYYEVLGIPNYSSENVIKRAYRKIAFKNHPDHHPDDKAAEDFFKKAAGVYETLGDPKKRAVYDLILAKNVGPGDFGQTFYVDVITVRELNQKIKDFIKSYSVMLQGWKENREKIERLKNSNLYVRELQYTLITEKVGKNKKPLDRLRKDYENLRPLSTYMHEPVTQKEYNTTSSLLDVVLLKLKRQFSLLKEVTDLVTQELKATSAVDGRASTQPTAPGKDGITNNYAFLPPGPKPF